MLFNLVFHRKMLSATCNYLLCTCTIQIQPEIQSNVHIFVCDLIVCGIHTLLCYNLKQTRKSVFFRTKDTSLMLAWTRHAQSIWKASCQILRHPLPAFNHPRQMTSAAASFNEECCIVVDTCKNLTRMSLESWLMQDDLNVGQRQSILETVLILLR